MTVVLKDDEHDPAVLREHVVVGHGRDGSERLRRGAHAAAREDVTRLKADQWIEMSKPVMAGMKATQHVITNHVITFQDDDHATCVAYVQARHHSPNTTGDSDQTVYGYYTNQFERTSQGWRIAKCKLTVSWMTGNYGLFGGVFQ